MKKDTAQQSDRSASTIVEIRAAEGGDDAKLLVDDQFKVYEKAAARRCL